MSTVDRSATSAVRIAILVSGLLIGFQVAGRATRDALFLSNFAVTSLPRMMAAAAIISLAAALLMSRVMSKVGPGKLVPILLVASAIVQVGEWGLLQVAPRLATILVYIQFNALGALLISAFWSLINERFDPRTAKGAVGFIGTAGTVGGIAGGLLAERAGAVLSVSAMLPALALIYLASAALVLQIRGAPASGAPRPAKALATVEPAGFRALAASPYLRLLAAMVLLGTISEGLLDYVFKASAKQAIGRGPDLLRFFAIFYMGINIVGGVVGAGLGKKFLEKFGLARATGMLPWGVAAGSVGAIAFPGLVSAVIARGIEATLRTSLFRSGYELLFTPLPPEEKRAAKPLLDVGAVRIGDMLAALCVQLALIAGVLHAWMVMLVMAAISAAAGIILIIRIHKGYIAALERSLMSRAGQLDLGAAAFERSTRMTMTREGINIPMLGRASVPGAPETSAFLDDPSLIRLADLYAMDVEKVRDALRDGPLEAVHVSRAIQLVAADEVSATALDALSAVAAQHTGQLVDALLNPVTDVTVRRRIPTAIGRGLNGRALDGLLHGLHDPRFEVRVRCGRALSRLAMEAPHLVIDANRVLAAVLNEVAVDRSVWENQHALVEDEADTLEVGNALRERTSRSLEHVFIVLSLVLPRQPLQIAFQGLHTNDPQLRGTALEYLETSLPVEVRVKLWPFIGDHQKDPRPSRTKEQVVAELIAARSSIAMSVEEIERLRAADTGAG